MFLFRNVNQKGIKALMSRDKKLANELQEDIDSIARNTLDEESLTTIMGLFCRKWEQEKVVKVQAAKEALKEAVTYFKNSWVKRDDVRNWWQGARPCRSSIVLAPSFNVFAPSLVTLLHQIYLVFAPTLLL